MRLTPTRSVKDEKVKNVNLSTAMLSPSSAHGGLYAPKKLPKITKAKWQELSSLSYEKLALHIISLFKFDVSEAFFKKALKRYASFDDPKHPVIFKKIDKNLYVNELYHGPTRAFKDMALQPFGSLLSQLAKERNERYLIMCATSGDTGPATLQTFANDENIKVVCLYPDGGTSEVQKLQMQTMQGENLKVFGIKGDFDDAQRALKTLLANDNFKAELKKKRLKLSAANSVNFGRILFQIIYHAYAYANLLKQKALKANESFDIIVPSGNFGNALGAYYAKKMGAKIGKIKIASNANNILTQFFTTGVYDLRDKKLVKTISPAMDILISSNVERLLFDKFGSERTNELMQSLAKNKFYKLSKQELEALKEDFEASWCDDKECEAYIEKLAKDGYAIDPHTATCFKMVDASRVSVITSTAHWVKFTPSMIKACQIKDTNDEKDALAKTAKILNDSVPNSINSLFSAKILHKNIIKEDEIEKCVLEWIER